DQRVAAEEPHEALGGTDQAQHHPQRRRLAGAVGAEIAEHVSRLDGEVDVVDGEDLAVTLDQAAKLDGRRVAHFSARAAVSAALGGSEPARTKATPLRCHSIAVPSWVASSCPVSPSSETVGRFESRPPWCPPPASALRST